MVRATLLLLLLPAVAAADALPASRPADLAFTLTSSDGLSATGSEVTVAGGKGTFVESSGDGRWEVPFSLTPRALDAVYAALRRHHFDKIHTHTEEVSDRGGVTLTVTAGGHRRTVADMGEDVVDDASATDWHAIVDAIHAEVMPAVEAAKVDVTISVDKSLAHRALEIEFDDGEVVTYVGGPGTYVARVYPGSHQVTVEENQAGVADVELDTAHGRTLRLRSRGGEVLVETP